MGQGIYYYSNRTPVDDDSRVEFFSLMYFPKKGESMRKLLFNLTYCIICVTISYIEVAYAR